MGLSRAIHRHAVLNFGLFHFAGGSSYCAEAVVFFVNSFLSDVDLVYGLGRRVDNVGVKGCLPDTKSVVVNMLNEFTALVNGNFCIPFCHFGCFCFSLCNFLIY